MLNLHQNSDLFLSTLYLTISVLSLVELSNGDLLIRTEKLTWYDARKECQRLPGGDLVMIKDEVISIQVDDYLSDQPVKGSIWIGLLGVATPPSKCHPSDNTEQECLSKKVVWAEDLEESSLVCDNSSDRHSCLTQEEKQENNNNSTKICKSRSCCWDSSTEDCSPPRSELLPINFTQLIGQSTQYLWGHLRQPTNYRICGRLYNVSALEMETCTDKVDTFLCQYSNQTDTTSAASSLASTSEQAASSTSESTNESTVTLTSSSHPPTSMKVYSITTDATTHSVVSKSCVDTSSVTATTSEPATTSTPSRTSSDILTSTASEETAKTSTILSPTTANQYLERSDQKGLIYGLSFGLGIPIFAGILVIITIKIYRKRREIRRMRSIHRFLSSVSTAGNSESNLLFDLEPTDIFAFAESSPSVRGSDNQSSNGRRFPSIIIN